MSWSITPPPQIFCLFAGKKQWDSGDPQASSASEQKKIEPTSLRGSPQGVRAAC
jgi:hypothetical protein